MQEAGATPEIELAYTLADGLRIYAELVSKLALKIDDFRTTFVFLLGNWNATF
jgi:methylmalonyl-CoA mutase